jgi:AraC family transcriptional regulator
VQLRNLNQTASRTIAPMNERAARTQDYAIRLERVVTWLADHLDDTLDLARLAEVACMSPYHFHRIYHAMQGETAADTVRRLRLHRAAVELIASERPVPRIAHRAGYRSQEAFTRAFKAAYGVPPARYRASFIPKERRSQGTPPRRSGRQQGMPPRRSGRQGIPADMPMTGRMEDEMEITSYQATIRETPPIRVAALAHRGDYQTIGATFQRLSTIAAEQGLFGPTTRSFGIYYDDPSATPRDALRSDACMTVPDGWTPSGELQLREIRGGRYVVTLHVGPYAELERPYRWLYGTWLAQSSEEAADAPCVEEYLNDARTVPPTELRTEIWLPLR